MHTIFITGGATGIGAATVSKFFAEGWNVCFMDINHEAAQDLCTSLDDSSSRLLFVEGDTRSRSEISRAVNACMEFFGTITSVFANAGVHRKNTILDVTDGELDLVIGTNIYGTVNTLREVLPHVIAAGGGTVVINASDQSFIGKRGSFAYGLTKGALGQITKSMALDLARYNVRVNAVCPGTVRTPLVERVFSEISIRTGESVGSLMDGEKAEFPLGRIAEPEEIAELVYFLASDKSSFCTGSLFLADGGLVAG